MASTTVTTTTAIGLAAFLAAVVAVCVRHFGMLFAVRHGRRHRWTGGLLLVWLCVGCVALLLVQVVELTVNTGKVLVDEVNNAAALQQQEQQQEQQQQQQGWWLLFYDIVLGCLGVAATLTAAADFPHRRASSNNAPGQSGTLSPTATVTAGEMREHAFYQILNLGQALYLHWNCSQSHSNINNNAMAVVRWDERWWALFFVTAPWLVRHWFPVHSFSHNWTKFSDNKDDGNSNAPKSTAEENRDNPKPQRAAAAAEEVNLYKVKKAQYLFYKHVILHGINLSVFLSPLAVRNDSRSLPSFGQQQQQRCVVRAAAWRLFWLCLNASYAMEFFLQSLVRRRVLAQRTMLALNRFLAVVATAAAASILLGFQQSAAVVRWDVCLASFLLNLVHRRHDVVNTLLIAAVAVAAGAAHQRSDVDVAASLFQCRRNGDHP